MKDLAHGAEGWIGVDGCACCGRRDGVTSGGCVYCGARTHCAACGQLLACGCGRTTGAHTCPRVVRVLPRVSGAIAP